MTTTITRSPRTRATIRTNYYPNPANANPVSGLHGVATAYSTASATGTYSIATGNFQQINAASLPANSRFGYYIDCPVSAPAGTQVAAAMYFQSRTGPAPIRLWVDCYTSAGTQVGHADVISSLTTNTLNVSVTTTDAITRIRFYVFFDNFTTAAMAASSIQVARYVLELGVPVAGSFFWGGQAASGTATYGWTGTTNNSASIMVDNNPADIFTPQLMTKYDMKRASKSNAIDIPGSSAPVVAFHAMAKRSGQLQFLLGAEPAARAFDALLSQQAAFVLADTDRPLVGMTFAVVDGSLGVSLDDETRGLFIGTADVKEQ